MRPSGHQFKDFKLHDDYRYGQTAPHGVLVWQCDIHNVLFHTSSGPQKTNNKIKSTLVTRGSSDVASNYQQPYYFLNNSFGHK